MKWNVIYLVNSERHLGATQFADSVSAEAYAADLRRGGWQAWAERVR